MENNMEHKKPFKQLKNALMIIASNHSSIMKEISKSKSYKKIENPFISTAGAPWHTLKAPRNDIEFDITIGNDYLPQLHLQKQSNKFIIMYNGATYYVDSYNISAHEDVGYPILQVDISGIDSKTDMFSLSTVRDFFDLDYNDIEALNYYMSSANSAYNKLKHNHV